MRVERIVEYEDIHNEKCHGHPICELIRCKDCRYFDDGWCDFNDSGFDADDYCSYGEKR